MKIPDITDELSRLERYNRWTWRDDVKWEINYRYRSVISFFRSIQTGITNLWEWKGIIWRDRWWDNYFLTVIIKKKLQIMHDQWDEAHYVASEVEKEELRILIGMLDEIERLEDEMDFNNEVDEIYEDFGKRLFTVETKTSTWEEKGETKTDTKTMSNIRRFWD